MPYIETQPAVSTPEDHKKWKQPDDPGPKKFGDVNVMRDSRLTKTFMWVAGVCSIIAASGITAVASKFFQMSDSLIRIESKSDAANKIQEFQFSQLDRRMGAVEGRVGAIEQRQIDAQNARARP